MAPPEMVGTVQPAQQQKEEQAAATTTATTSQQLDLRPKPRPAHGEGITTVAYTSTGHIVTAGENACINVFKTFEDEEARTLDDNQGAVTAIAMRGQRLVTGCEDHAVRLFDLKKGENALDCIVTRFQTPVRAVAFSPTGSAIAAGGDDMVIKIVTLSDMQCRELNGHDGAIRCICFDPQLETLISTSDDGFLRLWKVESGECVQEQAIMAEARGGSDPQREGMYGAEFDRSGEYIAVAVKNTVQVFDRNLVYKYKLKDLGHEAAVSCVRWSADGLYLASSAVDGTIIIWEVSTQQSMARYKHPRGACITSISWSEFGNELCYGDILGQFGIWRRPIREDEKAKPTVEQEAAAKKVAEANDADAALSNLFDDEDDSKRKLKRRRRPLNLDSDDEDEGEGVVSSAADDFIVEDDAPAHEYAAAAAPVFQQEAFQPASTPLDLPKRFLTWNDVGVIMSRAEETTSAVDVEFHDTTKHRPIRLVDHFGFTLGALNENAFVLAAQSHEPEAGDTRDHPSVLFCRNIAHWASDETWQIFFGEGEEVEALAVGGGETGFVAAATSQRYVRIYSMQGVVKHIMCLDGPIVAMAAHEERLMLAYHDGAGANGDQCISCLIFDVDKRKRVSSTRMPLSAGASLTWVGFSELGMPVMADSEETVKGLLAQWDYTWAPLIELKRIKDEKHRSDYHWITGVTSTELLCVICRGGETFPKVLPKPVVSTVPLQIPVVALADTAAHEERYLRGKMALDELQFSEGLSELDPADMKVLHAQRRKLDNSILACISRAVQSQRPGRALDLSTFLSLPASLDTAVKLAVKGRMPTLAERMTAVKHALEVAIKRRRRTERLALLGGGNQSDFVTPSRPTYLGMSETPDSGVDTPATAARPARRIRAEAPEPPTMDESMGDAEQEDEEVETPTMKVTAAKSKSPAKRKVTEAAPAPAPRPAMTNPFAKPAAKLTTPQNLERSQSLAHALNSSGDTNEDANAAKKSKKVVFEENAATEEKSTKVKAEQKKSKGAYLLWIKENRKGIMKANPGLKPSDLAKKAKEVWSALPAEEKAEWKTRAHGGASEAPAAKAEAPSETDTAAKAQVLGENDAAASTTDAPVKIEPSSGETQPVDDTATQDMESE